MIDMLDHRIQIAVSQCLLGYNVRYDGTSNLSAVVKALSAELYELIEFCPEMAIGMGVPRPPIRLDVIDNKTEARQIDDPSQVFTQALSDYADKFSQQYPNLKAVINKRSSPSCGHNTTKLFVDNGLVSHTATGIFIQQLKLRLPTLLLIDEEEFAVDTARQAFLQMLSES